MSDVLFAKCLEYSQYDIAPDDMKRVMHLDFGISQEAIKRFLKVSRNVSNNLILTVIPGLQ